MPNMIDIDLGRPARRLRVDTLSRLRWLALAGQAGAVLFTHLVLGFPLPLAACIGVIGLSAICNTWLRFHYAVTHRLNDETATALLGYDLVQLSALLYLTGGLENPFSMLFLAPVMISAASLPPPRTALLGGLAVVAATVLVRFHEPLPWRPGEEMHLPFLFSAGIWCAVVLGVGFIGVYASRVAEEARQLSDALAATELVLAREQHLTQLDGLAAAAAHELGTPLATITLVVREMLGLVAKAGTTIDVAQVADDIRLLDQEAQRCRAILGKLTSLGTESAGPLGEMTLSHLVEEVAGPQRNFDVAVTVTPIGFDEEPVCTRNPAILYGLGNLVENAVDFARERVQIDAHWTPDIVSVTVRDDGPGFAAEILSRLGEPYVTTRRAGGRAKSETNSGLGLGLFIAKTLLERSGAVVSTSNAFAPATGAVVSVTWPRDVFERGSARPTPKRSKAAKGRRAPVLY